MEHLTIISDETIESFIKNVKEHSDRISGSVTERWIMVKDIALGNAFNKSQADLVIQFPIDDPAPIVLLPETVEIEQDYGICEYFFNSEAYIPGWKRACYEMFAYAGEDLLDLVILVCGMLSQPDLCGAMGCSQKACIIKLNEHDAAPLIIQESNEN